MKNQMEFIPFGLISDEEIGQVVDVGNRSGKNG